MKPKYLVFTLLIVVFLSCKMTVEESKKTDGKSAVMAETLKAESLFQDIDGNAIALADFKGKRVLLNYWATWCRPCVEEMPAMLKAQEILEKENYVFLLASDQSFKTIKTFMKKNPFDLKFIKFNGSLSEQDISALPATFIYNTKGEKVEKIIGATAWDSPEMIERLKNIK